MTTHNTHVHQQSSHTTNQHTVANTQCTCNYHMNTHKSTHNDLNIQYTHINNSDNTSPVNTKHNTSSSDDITSQHTMTKHTTHVCTSVQVTTHHQSIHNDLNTIHIHIYIKFKSLHRAKHPVTSQHLHQKTNMQCMQSLGQAECRVKWCKPGVLHLEVSTYAITKQLHMCMHRKNQIVYNLWHKGYKEQCNTGYPYMYFGQKCKTIANHRHHAIFVSKFLGDFQIFVPFGQGMHAALICFSPQGIRKNIKYPLDKFFKNLAHLGVKMTSLNQKHKIIMEVANISVSKLHTSLEDIKLSGKLAISVEENCVKSKVKRGNVAF